MQPVPGYAIVVIDEVTTNLEAAAGARARHRTSRVRSSWLPLTLAMLALAPMTAGAGWVRGHIRRDGTYAPPHYRNPPGFGRSDDHATTSPSPSRSSARDPEERRAFVRTHPCPSTGKTSGSCPGYVVGYIVPLKHGGADVPYNMQWQPVGAAKAKTT